MDVAEDNMLHQFPEEVSMMNNKDSLKNRQMRFADHVYSISPDPDGKTEFVKDSAGGFHIDIDLLGNVEAISTQ